MSNLSTIDGMPNITSNFSDDVYHYEGTDYNRIFLEVFTAAGLLSITANSLIVFVILKYKKMREDATNVIFMHINVLQAIYLLATPLTLRVAMAIFHMSSLHLTIFCVSYQVESALIFTTTWFFMLLICDWYLKLYYKDKYKRFCRVQKFFVIALYVILICTGSLTTQACFKFMMTVFTHLTMFACVVLFVICLIVMNIVHFFKKKRLLSVPKKGIIGLAVTNITFLSWAPLVLFSLICIFIHLFNAPILAIILFSLGSLGPVFNLLYLYYYDDNYHIFLRQVFQCKCNEYQNEDLEDQSVSYNDANGVKISIN